MERTIRVTGKGKVSKRPDRVRILLELKGVNELYDRILAESSKMVEILQKCLTTVCIKPDELKTLSFEVNIKNENYQEGNIWKQRFVGYEFVHELKLEIIADNDLLGKVLSALSQCEAAPLINIEYTLSDVEEAKNELLAKAVTDSRNKAEILTKAAGVTLGAVQTIEYAWDDMNFATRPVGNLMRAAISHEPQAAYAFNVEPDNIEVTDTVTVIWQIF